jgi:lysophospholipase L1-like esterase
VRRLMIAAAGASIATAVLAQIALDPKSQFSVDWNKRLSTDWPYLARYRSDNAQLVTTPGRKRVVFMGDSITEGWVRLAGNFFIPGRIGRGIGGQTTPQMLVRFRQDVIDLHPDVVQIMAGTNDIAGNTGPMSSKETEDNIRSMVELAHAHGIRVIIASIPPSDHFPWKPELAVAQEIADMNSWLRAYAARAGCVYADYWTALRQRDGLGMAEGLSSDHVHPTAAGYAVMAPVAERAIRQALAMPAPHRTAVD